MRSRTQTMKNDNNKGAARAERPWLGHLSRFSALALICVVAVDAQAQTPSLVARNIAAGSLHNLVVLPDKTVKVWGHNAGGQLGLGSFSTQLTPQVITSANLNNVIAVSASGTQSFALQGDGTVKSWGNNMYGQLGLGNFTDRNTPQLIPAANLSNVVAIAVGSSHALALLADGTVKSWGHNLRGELGIGNTTAQNTPQLIPVASLSNVVDIAAGADWSLAILADGTVKAWGGNAQGTLGIGNQIDQSVPQPIPAANLSNVVAVSAGYNHCLALLGDGTVKGWGYNIYGQLGLGFASLVVSSPQPIPQANLNNVVAVSAGDSSSYALLNDGTIKAWGSNASGKLGLGNLANQTTPQLIPAASLSGGAVIESGTNHALAVLSDGTVKAWGQGNYGQLGIGSTTSQTTPQAIPGLTLLGLDCSVAATRPIGSSSTWSVHDYLSGGLGAAYLFDVSLTGSTPGISIPGAGTIPLNPPLLALHYGPAFAPFLSNFSGVLNANGHASPSVFVPHLPFLVGTTVTGAALTLDPTSATLVGRISNAAATVLVAPVASLSAVVPASVPQAGGTMVTITGVGFVPGASVTMGGIAASNVAVVDQWTITCTVPAHAPGTGIVSVTNPGASAGSWSGQFIWF